MAGEVACPRCEGVSPFATASVDRNRAISTQEFRYYQCSDCHLFFIDPVPGDLSRYYTGGYQAVPGSLDELRALAAPERYRLEPVLRHKREGRLLEIGPWIGLFSINAKDAGFDVDVIEMNDEAAAFLRDIVGVNVTQSNDAAGVLAASDQQYDVIAMWHSVEHLPQAWRVIEAAARRLKPDGIMLIALPNIASEQFKRMTSKWVHLDAPRHLYFWSPGALVRMAEEAGLKPLEVTTGDALSDELRRAAEIDRIRRAVPIRFVRGALARTVPPVVDALRKPDPKGSEGAGITAVFQLA